MMMTIIIIRRPLRYYRERDTGQVAHHLYDTIINPVPFGKRVRFDRIITMEVPTPVVVVDTLGIIHMIPDTTAAGAIEMTMMHIMRIQGVATAAVMADMFEYARVMRLFIHMQVILYNISNGCMSSPNQGAIQELLTNETSDVDHLRLNVVPMREGAQRAIPYNLLSPTNSLP
jgi:hypothetical protein